MKENKLKDSLSCEERLQNTNIDNVTAKGSIYLGPSMKMKGMEKDDVSKGSFKWDPASLPTYQYQRGTCHVPPLV